MARTSVATEQQEMYALKVGKNGLNKERIKATKPDDCLTPDEYFAADPALRGNKICGRYFVTMTSWELSGMTLKQLANALSGTMDRFVLDQTGVDTPFSFVLEFRTAPDDTTPAEGRTIRALEAVGLKIEETKGPAEYLVIESVQKPRPDAPSNDAPVPSRARGAAGR